MNKSLPPEVEQLISLALIEDIGSGDITTRAVYDGRMQVSGILKAKETGIIAGLKLSEHIYSRVDDSIHWQAMCEDGARVNESDVIARIQGPARQILTAERTVLNFLQRMSGIATITNQFVNAVKHTNTRILDTRKTVPGHRYLDKWAVRLGGGKNHRMRLDNLFLIKENHIKVAGGVVEAIDDCRRWREKHNINIGIEIEIQAFDQVEQVLSTGLADYILLDNMSLDEMHRIVQYVDGKIKLEASGNMTLDRVAKVAETGVDFISVGALTHSVRAMDISFLLS